MSGELEQQAQAHLQQGNLDAAVTIWETCARQGASVDKIAEWVAQLHALYCISRCPILLDCLLNHPAGAASDYLSVAKLYFILARFEPAGELTAKALEIEPDNPDIVVMMASCLERTDENDRASELLQKVLEKRPDHGRATRLLAHIHRRAGDFDRAKELLVDHLRDHPSDEDWRLQYELAAVFDRQGNHQAAMRNLINAKKQLSHRVPREQAEKLAQKQWRFTQLISHNVVNGWRSQIPCYSPKQDLCLLAGFPRSGTTLLENILCSHSACIGTDETGILATQFTNPLVIEASSAVSALEEFESFTAEEISAGREEYLRCTEDYIGESVGNRWLIEKEPLLTSYLAVPLRLFPDAKIIMPLRDPRDVVISYSFTLVPLNAESAAAESIGTACRFYAEVMRHWLHFKEILPADQWLESRYEDLLADPEVQTKKLADFLGIEWSMDMLSHHRRKGSRNVSTPTYDDVSKPLYTRSLARWKNYESHLEPHLHHLAPYIEEFGYDL